MPEGDRRIIIAAFGWLALSSPSEAQAPGRDEPKTQSASESKLDRIAAAIEKLPKAEAPDRGCPGRQEYRQSDLCAQWKAADAGSDAVAGLIIGVGTLLAAGFAAKFARDAAIHTAAGAAESKRAATAAERSVEQSREASHSDLRAWVKIALGLVGCKRNPGFTGITVNFALENIGKTPALRVSVSAKAYVIPSIVTDYGKLPSLNETTHQLSPLMPGGRIEQPIQARIELSDIQEGIKASRKAGFQPIIFIDGVVFYHTVFDAEDAPKRMTSIRYLMNHTIQQGHEFREARMAWLDVRGPVNGEVAYSHEKSAPVYLT